MTLKEHITQLFETTLLFYRNTTSPLLSLRTNTVATVMCFLLTHLWVWLNILCLPPTHYNDPSMTTITGESPETVRFAHHTLLDSYGVVVVDWKRMNSLKLETRGVYRVHRPAAAIVTLLLACGDIEGNPGPVQYLCTVCEKPVKGDQHGNSVDARHLGASLSEKQTADLLLCHGKQPAGFVTVDCLSQMHAKSSPQINVSITYASHFSSQGS